MPTYTYFELVLEDFLNLSFGKSTWGSDLKIQKYKNIAFHTFEKSYDSTVWSILDYCSSLLCTQNITTPGFYKYDLVVESQNQAIIYYICLPKSKFRGL